MLENYDHLIALSLSISKPDVISLLEQRKSAGWRKEKWTEISFQLQDLTKLLNCLVWTQKNETAGNQSNKGREKKKLYIKNYSTLKKGYFQNCYTDLMQFQSKFQ